MADDSFSSSSEGWDAKAVADDDEDVQPGVSLSPAKRTGSKPNSETPNSAKKRKHDKGSAVGQSSKQLSRKRAKTGPHPRISAVDEAMKKFLSSLGTNVALCNIAGASPSVFHKIVEAAELTPLETAIVQTEFLKQKSALKSNPNTPVRSPNSMTSSADPLSTRFNAHSRPAQRKPERKQQGQARQEFSGKKNQVGKVASNAAKPSTATAGSVSSKTAKPSTAGAEKQERKRQQSLTAMRSATPKGAEDSLTEVVVLNLPFDCKEPQVKNFLGSAASIVAFRFGTTKKGTHNGSAFLSVKSDALERILLKNGQSLDNRVLRVEKKRSADSDTQRASGLTQPAAGSEQAPTAALSCADTKSTELASAGSSDSSDDELDAAALAAAAKPMKAAGASARSASNAQPPAAAQAARNSNKLKEGPASPPTVTGAKAKAKNMKSQASAPAASKPEAKSKASKSKAAPSVAGQVNVRVKKSKSAPIAAPTVASDSESEFEQEK